LLSLCSECILIIQHIHIFTYYLSEVGRLFLYAFYDLHLYTAKFVISVDNSSTNFRCMGAYSWIMTISMHTNLVTNCEVQDFIEKFLETFSVVWNLIAHHGSCSDFLNPVCMCTTHFLWSL
jgi:hypothetical protein